MKTFKIPVRWELSSFVEVEAETLEEAIESAIKYEHEVGYELPKDGEYIDGSFEVDGDEEWAEIFNYEEKYDEQK